MHEQMGLQNTENKLGKGKTGIRFVHGRHSNEYRWPEAERVKNMENFLFPASSDDTNIPFPVVLFQCVIYFAPERCPMTAHPDFRSLKLVCLGIICGHQAWSLFASQDTNTYLWVKKGCPIGRNRKRKQKRCFPALCLTHSLKAHLQRGRFPRHSTTLELLQDRF